MKSGVVNLTLSTTSNATGWLKFTYFSEFSNSLRPSYLATLESDLLSNFDNLLLFRPGRQTVFHNLSCRIVFQAWRLKGLNSPFLPLKFPYYNKKINQFYMRIIPLLFFCREKAPEKCPYDELKSTVFPLDKNNEKNLSPVRLNFFTLRELFDYYGILFYNPGPLKQWFWEKQ